ncbi:MAG: hypothetical protein CMP10_01670 [Zetaproteobacteria bacterium]|nr:hypothetical protein [Pseudobdellovibrionaceae bacterium]
MSESRFIRKSVTFFSLISAIILLQGCGTTDELSERAQPQVLTTNQGQVGIAANQQIIKKISWSNKSSSFNFDQPKSCMQLKPPSRNLGWNIQETTLEPQKRCRQRELGTKRCVSWWYDWTVVCTYTLVN